MNGSLKCTIGCNTAEPSQTIECDRYFYEKCKLDADWILLLNSVVWKCQNVLKAILLRTVREWEMQRDLKMLKTGVMKENINTKQWNNERSNKKHWNCVCGGGVGLKPVELGCKRLLFFCSSSSEFNLSVNLPFEISKICSQTLRFRQSSMRKLVLQEKAWTGTVYLKRFCLIWWVACFMLENSHNKNRQHLCFKVRELQKLNILAWTAGWCWGLLWSPVDSHAPDWVFGNQVVFKPSRGTRSLCFYA